jgi:hypothetical protein
VRPPLLSLSDDQKAALIQELRQLDFEMPALIG